MLNRYLCLSGVVALLAGCAGTNNVENVQIQPSTPTVDYIEGLDVYSAKHTDSFLHQLAMNYRSFAIYNARTSGYPEIGELFAQKAITAFAGETPFPESLDNWIVDDENKQFEIYTAYNKLLNELKNDSVETQPQITAEAQAKFDCWISATASGQYDTATECKERFEKALQTISDCNNGHVVSATKVKSENLTVETTEQTDTYYPETRDLTAMSGITRTRDSIVIVNNINVPEQAPQMVINQNITGDADETDTETTTQEYEQHVEQNMEDYVTKTEFVNMMMEMRAELAAINKRLDDLNKNTPSQREEKTIIKVQQIPLEPKQHVMEEIFEIRFDFDKSNIKPEYQEIINKLVETTQQNKNVKISVVGHTDTAGSNSYNYALGGRRAEAVRKMLIEYGIPSSQIIAVSSGEEDLKVKTPDNTPKAENRRVRVVKEVQYTEQPKQISSPIIVEEYTTEEEKYEPDTEE
ncbi:MAG: OmpA family protein [Alphaproteobacteria bacterium]|nr:OmpA family protein [Alphaproteobacteria bacterium]